MHIIGNIKGLTAKNPAIGGGNTLAKSIYSAAQILKRPMPKPQTLAQKQGIRYEKNVIKALKAHGLIIEHNPWFEYETLDRVCSWCIPDALIHINEEIIVAEIKLTYTPEALEKLLNVYCPVIEKALKCKAAPLVIIKNALLINSGLTTCLDLYDALKSPLPIYQWIGRGPIAARGVQSGISGPQPHHTPRD
jgi:hypothetical protein